MDALIFIDTNILLDFYRVRSGGAGLSLLEYIDKHHDKIITGSQIEMEFKKNRQRVMQESLNRIKNPEWSGLSPPAFLTEAKPIKAIKKAKKEITQQQKTLKTRLASAIRYPSRNDPVYKTLQRLFKKKSDYNLDRSKKIRKKIRVLARNRFILGYPPRKQGDTSMGDAVNWEWVIHCAQESGKDIVIVSRDSDYGISLNDEYILNDWLNIEYSERVSRKRKIVLTDRLAHAFKLTSIRVTKKEEEEEKELLEEISASLSSVIDIPTRKTSSNIFSDFFKLIEEIESAKGKNPNDQNTD